MSLTQYRNESQSFTSENLKELCSELLQWKQTGILCTGKLRELADSCELWSSRQTSLRIAESLVEEEAMKFVVIYK